MERSWSYAPGFRDPPKQSSGCPKSTVVSYPAPLETGNGAQNISRPILAPILRRPEERMGRSRPGRKPHREGDLRTSAKRTGDRSSKAPRRRRIRHPLGVGTTGDRRESDRSHRLSHVRGRASIAPKPQVLGALLADRSRWAEPSMGGNAYAFRFRSF